MFPVITVSGAPFERGLQYGTLARDRVRGSVASYAWLFRELTGWDWAEATGEARRFLPAIKAFAPSYVDEMSGIAKGADLTMDDVLAINVRTEVIYTARVKTALSQAAPAECSAFASVTPDGRVTSGQNWDWNPFACDTVVVLQAVPDDGPAFVTVVEAGLLAKFGVNSEGLAVMTNAMACTEDHGDAAVPYHVMLRALFDCRSTEDAWERLAGSIRASSANYLLADKGGSVIDVEARPGDASRLHRIERAGRGALLHTNHFVSPDFDAIDYSDLVTSTTRTRLGQLTDLVDSSDEPDPMELFSAALRDHTNEPESVCRHRDPILPVLDQSMTVASALVDVTGHRVRVAEGPPCEQGFEDLDCSWLWG